jgi:GAF domain-containing protein
LIATEQAALRRVATLVARQTTPDELFATVAKEVAELFAAQWSNVLRYDPRGNVTLVGAYGEGPQLDVGDSWTLDAAVMAKEIWRTGRPASLDVSDYDSPLAAVMLGAGLRFATGVPIVVDGQLWGVITVLDSARNQSGDDLVSRLESFTELVATAVANATNHSELVAASGD